MKMKSSYIAIVSFILLGCSKAPDPVTFDENSIVTTANQGLVESRISEVPKDPFLQKNNWTYQIKATKERGFLLKNNQVAKTFYVAQNADKIIIIGKFLLINEYKKYFLENGVTALIDLQPITPLQKDENSVKMLFFHVKKGS